MNRKNNRVLKGQHSSLGSHKEEANPLKRLVYGEICITESQFWNVPSASLRSLLPLR